ncbi:MBL fold metallo-hydrolase [Empedobacter sp. GD03865]|jgi:beta-lactamase superfamily II metal-dependent hydrolase|uniref:ComEC/Rec2 family competence protein n=1 Tax=Empedobacter sp. GD03865 TaxID=2975392 RepID=UPI00244D6503|nr:MBL fold metallo-hydrolase [Empedobacter sp. GD03865]MDH0660753.1 MBL fold metallo-hydrolase [Empedobacter sp. GD03865]
MSQTVKIIFWDVQAGHATYIKSPNGKHIVIDLGIGSFDDNNQGFSPLMYLKHYMGVKQLDYVIITHPHLDHIEDIVNFDELNPKILLRPKHITNEEVMQEEKATTTIRNRDKPIFEKYCEINNRYNSPVDENNTSNPRKSDNYGGLKIRTFHPTSCNKNNFNNHSIITVLEFQDIKIVIPGDNERCSFEELLLKESFNDAIKDADILLAPHHGRESGYNNEFMNIVNPNLTIISDGRFCDTSATTRYSQKSKGWKVHYNDGSSEVRKCLTTRTDGEIFVDFGLRSDGKKFLQVKTKK